MHRERWDEYERSDRHRSNGAPRHAIRRRIGGADPRSNEAPRWAERSSNAAAFRRCGHSHAKRHAAPNAPRLWSRRLRLAPARELERRSAGRQQQGACRAVDSNPAPQRPDLRVSARSLIRRQAQAVAGAAGGGHPGRLRLPTRALCASKRESDRSRVPSHYCFTAHDIPCCRCRLRVLDALRTRAQLQQSLNQE